MNARSLLALGWLTTAACATTSSTPPDSTLPASSATAEDARFSDLLKEDWERDLREYPEFATIVGDPRYNDRLADQSLEAIARRKQEARELLERLKGIDRSRLSAPQQLNYDLFR